LANRDVDVVINLTIPDTHFAMTERILEAGKHAYSEKPLVLTLDRGVTRRDLAKSKGRAARPTRSLAARTRRPAPRWTKAGSARSPQAAPPS
jgi:hypothetical protein